jgi:hypothetical protein
MDHLLSKEFVDFICSSEYIETKNPLWDLWVTIEVDAVITELFIAKVVNKKSIYCSFLFSVEKCVAVLL